MTCKAFATPSRAGSRTHPECGSGAADLGAERRESRLVLGVDSTATGTAALLGAGTGGGTTATLATSTATTATALAATTSTTSLTTVTTSTTGTTTATVSSVGSGVVLAVKSERVLGLVLLGAVLLGAGASEVLLVGALDGLALGELLAGALVGLADGEAVAGEVLLVGLGVVLLGGLGGGGDAVRAGGEGRVGGSGVSSEAGVVLRFSGGNVGTSLLVGPLGLALYAAPTVTSLLLVLASIVLVRWVGHVNNAIELTQCQCGCDGRRERA
jgi:hypothetical protein